MTIETKFNVGDEVFFKNDITNDAQKGEVVAIHIRQLKYGKSLRIRYNISDISGSISEEDLFKTKQELIDSL